MGMPRRRFLGYAAGVATPAWPFDLRSPDRSHGAAVLDLKEFCSLRESLAGYESALAGLAPRRATLIVPAALTLPPPAVRAIVSCLQAGGIVLLESGAGFAAGREFRAHRDALRDYLQVRIQAPVPLWSAPTRGPRIPYVDYTWPSSAKLRDFSRVVPLGRQAGEVIAWVDGLPVALKRRSGRGTLIFLGSPLGPALWAGDAQARRWLVDVLAS